MCAGNCKAGFAVGEFPKHLGALDDIVSLFSCDGQFFQGIRHCRSIYYQCVLNIWWQL